MVRDVVVRFCSESDQDWNAAIRSCATALRWDVALVLLEGLVASGLQAATWNGTVVCSAK